jgi:sulfopyruvate decarboxylase TPP-binding subunit
MVETTLAVGDIINAIPSLYHSLQEPIALITILIGAGAGAFSLHKGVGKAVGKVIGGIALASLVFGGASLAHSINMTVNDHSTAGWFLTDTGTDWAGG